MKTARTMASKQTDSGATTGYEAELWAMADALRGSMDAAEYKHVVLGIIFLKYISDGFQRAPRGGAGRMGRGGRRGPRRVHRRKHLLGTAGSPLGTPEGPGEAADHRPDRGSGHDRDRAGQPGAEGGAAQGLRAARPGQAASRPADRHDREHPRRGTPKPAPATCSGASTSTSSRSSRVPREKRAASSTPRAVSSAGSLPSRPGISCSESFDPTSHKVGIAPVDGLCSTDIVVLVARKPKWSAFVLACVSSSAFVAHTSQTATGTKMPRTSWRAMRRYELCRPTDTIASEFQRIVSRMLRRIVGNIHESRTLAALRDTLLPQLISGELRVHAAERLLGRAE